MYLYGMRIAGNIYLTITYLKKMRTENNNLKNQEKLNSLKNMPK